MRHSIQNFFPETLNHTATLPDLPTHTLVRGLAWGYAHHPVPGPLIYLEAKKVFELLSQHSTGGVTLFWNNPGSSCNVTHYCAKIKETRPRYVHPTIHSSSSGRDRARTLNRKTLTYVDFLEIPPAQEAQILCHINILTHNT